MIKKCEFCGKPFDVDDNNHHERRRKYCSELCLKKRNNVERNKGKQHFNLICVICGKVFLSNRRDRVCCSPECSEERNKELAKERFKKSYWKSKEEAKGCKAIYEPPKRKKITPAHEIEAEARKLGMHYGQYYALMLQKQEIEEREQRKLLLRQIGE